MDTESESRTSRKNDSFAWNPHHLTSEEHTGGLGGKPINSTHLLNSDQMPQPINVEPGTLGFSEGIQGAEPLGLPINQELLLKSQIELSENAAAPLPTFGAPSSMMVMEDISSTWVAREQRDVKQVRPGSDLVESVGSKPNPNDSLKTSVSSQQENISDVLFKEDSTHKRPREGGDAENYPPEKIPALEITTAPTISNDHTEVNQKPALGNNSATHSNVSTDSGQSQPTLSTPTLPTASLAPLSQPATPPTSGQTVLTKASGTSPIGHRDNTNRPFESVGNESHSDVMGMPATKMMARLRQRSVELDALRDGVREWLCVLQPDLSLQLRARPWPEVCRLFSRLLQANRTT